MVFVGVQFVSYVNWISSFNNAHRTEEEYTLLSRSTLFRGSHCRELTQKSS